MSDNCASCGARIPTVWTDAVITDTIELLRLEVAGVVIEVRKDREVPVGYRDDTAWDAVGRELVRMLREKYAIARCGQLRKQ